MTVTNGYVTLTNLKSRLGIADTTDDDNLEASINSVSRWIDKYCQRRFYGKSEVRYYTPENRRVLYIDDLLSVTTLGTDEDGDLTHENTWATTDYVLTPYNAAADGQPFTGIQVTPNGSYTFMAGVVKSVLLNGLFGYCTYGTGAPYEVQEACYIQCARIFKRKDSPFGIAGKSDLGEIAMIPKLDVDVKTLLDPYRRII